MSHHTNETAELPDLLYSDVEDDLRTAVRDLLQDTAPWSSVLAELEEPTQGPGKPWTRLASELGCAALPVPEELGGAGASWREAAVVLEELGRAVTPGPYFTSAILATAVLLSARADDLVSELAAGDQIAALLVPLTWTSTQTEPTITVSDDMLSGTVSIVAGALEADILIVPTAQGLFAVEASAAAVEPLDVLDMTRRLADVSLDRARGRQLAEPAQSRSALDHAAAVAAAMLASEQLGIATWCLDTTVAYLQERRQFGRVLASYQALKHRLADLWTDLAQARAVARYAAAVAAQSTPDAPGDLPVAASLAQVVCSRVAQRAAEECVQLHGGIGFTWEHPAHLYLKRARTDALALGSPSYHRGRIGELVDLPRATR